MLSYLQVRFTITFNCYSTIAFMNDPLMPKAKFEHQPVLGLAIELQWGSEYRTSLVFEWSKVVRSPKG